MDLSEAWDKHRASSDGRAAVQGAESPRFVPDLVYDAIGGRTRLPPTLR